MAAPQRGGGASERGRSHAEGVELRGGAEPRGWAVPRRGGAMEPLKQKALQEQVAGPEQDAGGLGGQSSKSAGLSLARNAPRSSRKGPVWALKLQQVENNRSHVKRVPRPLRS